MEGKTMSVSRGRREAEAGVAMIPLVPASSSRAATRRIKRERHVDEDRSVPNGGQQGAGCSRADEQQLLLGTHTAPSSGLPSPACELAGPVLLAPTSACEPIMVSSEPEFFPDVDHLSPSRRGRRHRLQLPRSRTMSISSTLSNPKFLPNGSSCTHIPGAAEPDVPPSELGHRRYESFSSCRGKSTSVLLWNRHSFYNATPQIGTSNGDFQNASSSSPSRSSRTRFCRLWLSLHSAKLKKGLFGILLLFVVTTSWVGATQLLKASYTGLFYPSLFRAEIWALGRERLQQSSSNATSDYSGTSSRSDAAFVTSDTNPEDFLYDAPFFTTWFCTMGTILFLPIYALCQLLGGARKNGLRGAMKEGIRNLRDKGFTFGKYLSRCCLFSCLWVLTNYLYVASLRVLGCTEVMALFATNACCIYLLSWVILHQQFVGIRIVAVILSNTGIALLAYMDGITQTPTLGGVVLAAAAAAGSAIYKVLFKRVLGEVSFCQVALFFTSIGLCSTLLFWPLVLLLALTGAETLPLNDDAMPWTPLTLAATLALMTNLLANFGMVVTYETFITLGLALAIPVCSIFDIYWYGKTFEGMKLAGIILIGIGFLIVLFPNNWPDAIYKIIRWGRRTQSGDQGKPLKPAPDLRTGHIGSRLRSPSGRVK